MNWEICPICPSHGRVSVSIGRKWAPRRCPQTPLGRLEVCSPPSSTHRHGFSRDSQTTGGGGEPFPLASHARVQVRQRRAARAGRRASAGVERPKARAAPGPVFACPGVCETANGGHERNIPRLRALAFLRILWNSAQAGQLCSLEDSGTLRTWTLEASREQRAVPAAACVLQTERPPCLGLFQMRPRSCQQRACCITVYALAARAPQKMQWQLEKPFPQPVPVAPAPALSPLQAGIGAVPAGEVSVATHPLVAGCWNPHDPNAVRRERTRYTAGRSVWAWQQHFLVRPPFPPCSETPNQPPRRRRPPRSRW